MALKRSHFKEKCTPVFLQGYLLYQVKTKSVLCIRAPFQVDPTTVCWSMTEQSTILKWLDFGVQGTLELWLSPHNHLQSYFKRCNFLFWFLFCFIFFSALFVQFSTMRPGFNKELKFFFFFKPNSNNFNISNFTVSEKYSLHQLELN